MTERLAHLQWLYQLGTPTGAAQAQPRRGRLFGGLQEGSELHGLARHIE
jgi:hypothetical protein